MSAGIVFGQMLIIFALMLVGVVLCKCKIIEPSVSKQLSAIVVNVCSPMQLIMSVLNNSETTIARSNVVHFFLLSIVTYIILILFGFVYNWILRTPRPQRGDYHLMAIFGNCGFIGIPVARAILGEESLIYVAVFILIYNLFIYTYGLWIIVSGDGETKMENPIKQMINPGTIACIVTIVIFWFQIKVPEQVQSFCDYTGGPATFLALVVIGISLAGMSLKEMVEDVRFFCFVCIRFLLFPILFVSVSKIFIGDILIRGVLALMVAMPIGNMPAMMRSQFGQDDTMLAKGAIITTTLSVVTITITCMFV